MILSLEKKSVKGTVQRELRKIQPWTMGKLLKETSTNWFILEKAVLDKSTIINVEINFSD